MSSTRVTRSKRKKQEDLLDKLSPNKKDLLQKNVLKLQSIYRGKKTRKNLSKITKDIELYKEKKYKESIGPKYYKTLKELSGEKVNKIISNIFSKFEIQDEDSKKMLISNILLDKAVNEIDDILSIIINIYKEKLKLITKLSGKLNMLIGYSIYPSSADEEEIELINEEYFLPKQQLRDEMSYLFQDYNKINIIFDKIKDLLIKILELLGDYHKNIKIKKFIDLLKIDWYEELDKSDLYRNRSIFELDKKKNFVKKNLLILKQDALKAIINLLEEKLQESGNIKLIIDKIAIIYNNILSLNESVKEKPVSKKSKKTNKRR